MMELHDPGVFDFINKKNNEHISCVRPNMQAKNLIYGGLYVDLEGDCKMVNNMTGEKVVINFIAKNGK